MIKTIYTRNNVWEVDTKLQDFVIGIDRVLIIDKKNADVNTIIFTDYIIAIETTEEPSDRLKKLSIGTSD